MSRPQFTRADSTTAPRSRDFAEAVDVATYEFENLPVEPLTLLGDKLRPGIESLAIAQDRAEEKSFIESTGARVAPWRAVASLEDVEARDRRARPAARPQDPPLRL